MKLTKTLYLLPVFIALFALSSSSSFAGRPSGVPKNTNGMARSCEAKAASVERRMSQLVDLSENQKRVFDAIAERVKTFYNDKVVPQGITVANYNELLTDIDAKKALVDDALAKAQTDADNFSCDNVKTSFTQFRQNMQAVKTSLKNYRTSIRNLIVAVHTALPDEPEETVTPSPTPTTTN